MPLNHTLQSPPEHTGDGQQGRLPSSTVDEATPLLAATPREPTDSTTEAETSGDNGPALSRNAVDDKPLPMGQILLLCITRLVDPVSMLCVFPFVPAMVQSMDVAGENVGFYTGLIESLFSIAQMMTMLFWGRLADRYGRKPVLCVSIFGVAVGTTLFGVSQHIWEMILFRSIAGAFSGSVVSIRAMFRDISTPRTQARAFSYYAFAGNLGVFVGPAISALARPAEQYPGTFGKVQLFRDWPYLLPTLVGGGICFIAFFTTLFFVKETLPPQKASGDSSASSSDAPMTTWQVIKSPGVPISLLAFSWVGLIVYALNAVIPVYYFTSIPLGGFGLTTSFISLLIAITGASQAAWLLIAFPPVQRRTGTKTLLQLCGAAWPITLLTFPLNNFFLRHGWDRAFCMLAVAYGVLGSAVAMGFTGVQLALNAAAPSPRALGTLNGVALTVNSAVRAFSPTAFSSVYAWSVKNRVLHGQFGMVLLAAMAAGFFGIASLLPRSADDRPGRRDEEEEAR